MTVHAFQPPFFDCTSCGTRVWTFTPRGSPRDPLSPELEAFARGLGFPAPETVCLDCVIAAARRTADA